MATWDRCSTFESWKRQRSRGIGRNTMPSRLRQRTRSVPKSHAETRGKQNGSATHASSTDAASPLQVLQRLLGNRGVERLLMAGGHAIQRYAVPGNLECDDVAPWLDSNSPFAPEWAETRSTFTFHGQ